MKSLYALLLLPLVGCATPAPPKGLTFPVEMTPSLQTMAPHPEDTLNLTLDLLSLRTPPSHGLAAPRRGGAHLWQDLTTWLQNYLKLDLRGVQTLRISHAPNTGWVLTLEGTIDASQFTFPRAMLGGRLYYALPQGYVLSPTQSSRRFVILQTRKALSAWRGRTPYPSIGRATPSLLRATIQLSALSSDLDQTLHIQANTQDLTATLRGPNARTTWMQLQGKLAQHAQKRHIQASRNADLSALSGLFEAHTLTRLLEVLKEDKTDNPEAVTLRWSGWRQDADTWLVHLMAANAPAWWRAREQRQQGREAITWLETISARAKKHFEAKCSFPASAPSVPAQKTCCGRTCDANLPGWRHPTWTALKATPTTPHRFTYRAERRTFAPGSESLLLEARGDLDCDTVLSTYRVRLFGHKKPDGTCAVDVEPVTWRNRED